MFSQRTEWKLTPNRFTEACERFRAEGRVALDLAASNPTRVGLPYNQAAILQALATPESLKYSPDAKGLLSAFAPKAGWRWIWRLPIPPA